MYVFTVHGSVSLEIYPPREPENEESLMERLLRHPVPISRYSYLERAAGFLPAYGDYLESWVRKRQDLNNISHKYYEELKDIDTKYAEIMEAVKTSTSPNELTQRLNAALEDVIKHRNSLRSSIRFHEKMIRGEDERLRPFPDHYLTVRSVHGGVALTVYDPDAFVDITSANRVSISPSDYTPRSTRRRIGVETWYGDIVISYKPQIPVNSEPEPK